MAAAEAAGIVKQGKPVICKPNHAVGSFFSGHVTAAQCSVSPATLLASPVLAQGLQLCAAVTQCGATDREAERHPALVDAGICSCT